jgi:hypothetical protein
MFIRASRNPEGAAEFRDKLYDVYTQHRVRARTG